MKKNIKQIFVDALYSEPSKKYPTKKIVYNQNIVEIWNIDLADMSDYKVSNKEAFMYTFFILDKFSEYTWGIPLKKTHKWLFNFYN